MNKPIVTKIIHSHITESIDTVVENLLSTVVGDSSFDIEVLQTISQSLLSNYNKVNAKITNVRYTKEDVSGFKDNISKEDRITFIDESVDIQS